MLRQRAISSVFIVALTLGAAILGRYLFALAIALIFGMVWHEVQAMFRHAGHRPSTVAGYAILAALLAVALVDRWAQAAALVTLAVILPLIAILFRNDHQGALTDWALTVAGALYVALPAAHFILLRGMAGELGSFLDTLDGWGRWQEAGRTALSLGLGWYLLAQVTTWLTDVGAYIAGRIAGRHKLAPAISPAKSIEGAIGGLVAGGAAAMSCAAAFALPLGWVEALIIGAVLSSLGQLGDLGESLLKRQAGVKDSGTLIPGHGGLFDRLDSLLVVVTATYYLARVLGGR